ncbi:MAG: GyrI-like domain-containing protein [Thermoplasmatota archaeon]
MSSPFDVRKEFGSYYQAGPEAEVVAPGAGTYLALDGHGAPRSAPFNASMHALYSCGLKLAGISGAKGFGFKLGPLEAQWWAKGHRELGSVPPAQWQWTLLLRIPEFVRAEWLSQAIEEATPKGGAAVARVRITNLEGQTVVQALHVGPYSRERPTMARMATLIEARQLKPTGVHHEVYLSDPAKTKNPKTILRQPVAR